MFVSEAVISLFSSRDAWEALVAIAGVVHRGVCGMLGSLLSRLGGCALQSSTSQLAGLLMITCTCVWAACSLPRVRLSKLLKLG